jgi:superfamily II DNA or RNA helicase
MLKLTVDNRVRLNPESLSKSAIADLKQEFEHKNPKYYALKARYGYSFVWKNVALPLEIFWKEEDNELSFPRGGLFRVTNILDKYEVQYEVGEHFTNPITSPLPDLCVQLYDYQERCLRAAVSERIGIISAPTGSGKTVTGLAIISELQVPFMIVCPTVALMKQWEDRIMSAFKTGFEIGRIQGIKHFNLQPITIASAVSLHKMTPEQWKQINDYFGGVILDECQFASAFTFMESIDECKMPYRIGLSADYTRKDKREYLIRDLFGDVIATVDKKDLVNREFILDVHTILEPTNFRADWFNQQRKAFDLKKSGCSFDEIYQELVKSWPELKMDDVPAGQPNWAKLIEEMTLDPERNEKIITQAQEFVKNGHATLLFCHRIDHINYLASRLGELSIKTGLLIGGPENKAEFKRTAAGLQSGEIQVGIGSVQALGTGIDISRVSRGIMATPVNGKQLWNQIKGRLCRTHYGKKDAEIVYMWDKLVFFNSPVKMHSTWNNLCSVNEQNRLVKSKEYLKQ